MLYLASFDVALPRHGFGLAIFIASDMVTSQAEVNVAAITAAVGSRNVSIFNHYTTKLSAVVGEDPDATVHLANEMPAVTFAAAMQVAMRAAATTAGWANPNALTCTFNLTTQRYTFARTTGGGATIGVAFGTDETAALFGMPAIGVPTITSVTGTLLPNFIISPTLSLISTVGGAQGVNYEPEGIATGAVSGSGHSSGMARPVSPLLRDWVQQYETKAKTLRANAVAAHPYSHQAMFEDCRNVLPIVVSAGFGESYDEVFKLRPDACQWSPDRASDGNDAQFHIPYGCEVLGVPS